MTIDIPNELNAIDRTVEKLPADADADAGERIGVTLRRIYSAPIGDVWDAITDPSRIKRWRGDPRVRATRPRARDLGRRYEHRGVELVGIGWRHSPAVGSHRAD